MKNRATLFLLSGLLVGTASAAHADGFDLYWRMGDGRGYDRHHYRPERHHAYQHDLSRWHGGRWVHSWRDGRDGWWWVVDDYYWYQYQAPVYPYPDIYAAPVYVAQPTTTTITTTMPAPLIQSTPVPSSGTEVHFSQNAIEASPSSATYIDPQGRTCRDYKTSVIVNGTQQQATGKACLQPDGTWRTAQ